MPSLNDMFPSKYLKAEDLRGKDGKGWREFNLTIKSVDFEKMGHDDDSSAESKWVLHFDGAEKGLPLNRVNAQTLADAYGPASELWVGERVILFVTTVSTPQGQKPGIRFRVPAVEGVPA